MKNIYAQDINQFTFKVDNIEIIEEGNCLQRFKWRCD